MLSRLIGKLPFSIQVLVLIAHHEVANLKNLINNRENTIWPRDKLSKLGKVVSDLTPKVNSGRSNGVILVDFFPIPLWASVNSIAVNSLARLTNSEVRVVDFYTPKGQNRSLYSKLGLSNFRRIRTSWRDLFSLIESYRKFFLDCKSKQDYLNYKVDAISIGLDIYESYLRSGHPTIDTADFRFRKTVLLALSQLLYLNRISKSKEIVAIFSSHENFVGPGLQAKFGFRYGIPVFFMNHLELNIPEKLFENHERYLRYPEYFNNLSNEEQIEGRITARKALERRTKGEIGVLMPYQQKSAFTSEVINRQLKYSTKKKFLIVTHDFFDNPHAFQILPFVDFLEWLTYLANVALKFPEYEWYLKIHRDYSDQERKIIDDFLSENSHIKEVDSETSFHQLKNEGLSLCFTCFGSVGHELPLLGIPVVTFSLNPHSAYSFTYPVRNLSKLDQVINQALECEVSNLQMEEIYEFFFVHKFLNHPNSFNVSDLSEFEDFGLTSVESLTYLCENFMVIQEKVIQNLNEALITKRKYSIERNLPSPKQLINNSPGLDRLAKLLSDQRME